MKNKNNKQVGVELFSSGLGFLVLSVIMWFIQDYEIDDLRYLFDNDYRDSAEFFSFAMAVIFLFGFSMTISGIITMCSKKKTTNVPQAHQICPNCKQEFSDKAAYCPHCGNKMNKRLNEAERDRAFAGDSEKISVNNENNKDDAEIATNTTIKDKTDKECLFCGAVLREDQMICTSCGRRQD